MTWLMLSTCPYIIMYLYEAIADARAHLPSLNLIQIVEASGECEYVQSKIKAIVILQQ